MKKTLFTFNSLSLGFIALVICTFCSTTSTAQCSGTQKMGREFLNGFQTEEECNFEWISQTPCSAIAGATLNDDAATTWATEYDYPSAPTDFNGTAALRALRQNNNMCMALAGSPPTHPLGWTTYSTDLTAYPYPMGMFGGVPQRSRGICPEGWHVPSLCEYWAFQYNVPTTVTYEGWTGLKNTAGTAFGIGTYCYIISSDIYYALLNGHQASYAWTIGSSYYNGSSTVAAHATPGETYVLYGSSPYPMWYGTISANTANNPKIDMNWVCGAN
jgi:hypothetical protein